MPPNLKTSARSWQAGIWAQYDELAWKNQEELDKYWSQQIEESTTAVTLQTTEAGMTEMTFSEMRRVVQVLDINLDSRNLRAILETILREVEMHYAMWMEQLDRILLHLESELAQPRGRAAAPGTRVQGPTKHQGQARG